MMIYYILEHKKNDDSMKNLHHNTKNVQISFNYTSHINIGFNTFNLR